MRSILDFVDHSTFLLEQVTIAQLTEQVKELRQFREEHSIDYEVLRKEKFKLKEE